jgi:hypothetical protein
MGLLSAPTSSDTAALEVNLGSPGVPEGPTFPRHPAASLWPCCEQMLNEIGSTAIAIPELRFGQVRS